MAIDQLPPFARLLRHYRLDAGLTQEELAERARLSARAIGDLERGVKTRPHRVTVELLADALSLTPEERTALLEAVPRSNGSHPAGETALQALVTVGAGARTMEAHPVRCPRELLQWVEGLVGMHVDNVGHDGTINVTVVVFSVGQNV